MTKTEDTQHVSRFTFQGSISVVLPAYNEEENVEQAVRSVLEVI